MPCKSGPGYKGGLRQCFAHRTKQQNSGFTVSQKCRLAAEKNTNLLSWRNCREVKGSLA